jgi:hypothetical protein
LREDFERKYITPIMYASYPGTLATLNLTVLQVTGNETPWIVRFLISLGSLTFLISAFTIFFFVLYPFRKSLWTITAVTFLGGLTFSLIAVIELIIV